MFNIDIFVDSEEESTNSRSTSEMVSNLHNKKQNPKKNYKQNYLKKEKERLQKEKEDVEEYKKSIKTTHPIVIKDHLDKEYILEEFINLEYQNYPPPDLKEKIQNFDKEKYYGNKEYKLHLKELTKQKLEKRSTQMKFRLVEGHGQAIYLIGVEDHGYSQGLSKEDMYESLSNLCQMARANKADVTIQSMMKGNHGKIAQIMVKQNIQDGVKLDIRVLLLGEAGSGKSTLLSVLNFGEADDGKGKMRAKFIKHQHELFNQKSSGMKIHHIGFDSSGKIITKQEKSILGDDGTDTLLQSTKVITFIDVPGHKKAEKGLLLSLCSFFPDYSILIINCLKGISQVTEDHIKYVQVFSLPLIIIITHYDGSNSQEINTLIDNIKIKIKQFFPGKILIFAKTAEDNQLFSRTLLKEDITPVFLVSSVSGENLKQLQQFLSLLPVVQPSLEENPNNCTEFFISGKIWNEKHFESVIFKGTIINGILKKGVKLSLGPDKQGYFHPVEIMEIQCNYQKMGVVPCGQICAVQIKLCTFPPKDVRKFLVLVETKSDPRAVREFLVEMQLFDTTTDIEIKPGYHPVINTQTSRQSCIIIVPKREQELLQPGLVRRASKSVKPVEKTTQEFSKKLYKKERIKYKKNSVDFIKSARDGEDLRPFHYPQEKTIGEKQEEHKSTDSTEEEYKVDVGISGQDIPVLILRKNQKNYLRLRFLYFPEYIKKGQKLIISDTLLKAVGWVKEIYY